MKRVLLALTLLAGTAAAPAEVKAGGCNSAPSFHAKPCHSFGDGKSFTAPQPSFKAPRGGAFGSDSVLGLPRSPTRSHGGAVVVDRVTPLRTLPLVGGENFHGYTHIDPSVFVPRDYYRPTTPRRSNREAQF